MYLPRPAPGLEELLQGLTTAVLDFLLNRCGPGGDHHEGLTSPLAPAGPALPDNGRRPDPDAATGRASVDIPRLATTLHDSDDLSAVKGKLIHFARHDPWLFAELMVNVLDRLDQAGAGRDRDPAGGDDDVEATTIRTADDFLFRATGVDGRTPLELLLDRQRDLGAAQRQRVRRWIDESFHGTFQVRHVGIGSFDVVDLRTDREFRLHATKPEALARVRAGDIVYSRVVPWDDAWYLSGIQDTFARPDQTTVAKLRRDLRRLPLSGRLDPSDPHVAKAFAMQREQHDAWVKLFGADEVTFPDGRALEDAMRRFYRYWSYEMIDPVTGETRAQTYEREHGRPPAAAAEFALPEPLLEATDVAVISDPRWDTSFLEGYGAFRAAFASTGPVTAEQALRVWDYLSDPTIEPLVFERMRDRAPERTEQVMRTVLRDQEFRLDRDFGPTLRRFKGEHLRRGPQPSVTIVDEGDDGNPAL